MNKTISCATYFIGLLLLTSCSTYLIPVNSFKEQFANIAPSKLKEVTTRGPVGDKVKYLTFPMDSINCVDKKGNPVSLKVSPSLEIRFTDLNNKKTIFYFDLITVDENFVNGVQSRIITSIKKKIPVSSIKKIEIQDGKKNYKYVANK